MKGGQNLRELQSKKAKTVEDRWLPQLFCCVCSKEIEGYYSRHGNTGTCSKVCMSVQNAKPRFGEHTEAAFLKHFNLEATT